MKDLIYKIFTILTDFLFLVLVFFLLKHLDISLLEKCNINFNEFLFVFLIVIVLFYYEQIYKHRYDFWQESLKILKSLFISYLIVVSFFAIYKLSEIKCSEVFVSIYFFVLVFLFPFYKRIIKKILFKKLKIFRKKVNVVGNKEQKKMLVKEFRKNWYLGIKYDNRCYENVYIASKDMDISEVTDIIDMFSDNKEMYIVPYITDINFAHSQIMEYTNIRLNSIFIENKLLNKFNNFVKTSVDYLIALLILPVFLIVHSIISFLIKFDSEGPVIFKQKRLGKNGKIFYVYKYRTMYVDSKEILKEYLKNHPEEIQYYEKYHKYKNDPRITKIGKLLRATSLDELPQVFNVLRGEMSIVGPRPYMLDEKEKLGVNYKTILRVKPGITGLWQVSGRNNLTFKERNELEIWYIKNWSLWLDVIIMLKTVKVVLLKIGAK